MDKSSNLIGEDLSVAGSACIGLDCVEGETYNLDDLKLKDNNTSSTTPAARPTSQPATGC